MRWTLISLAVVFGAFILDRLLLWVEDRGWIYYRKRKPNITSLSTALFQMQAIVQPEKQHIVEQKLEIKEDEDEDGDKGHKRKPPPPSGSSA